MFVRARGETPDEALLTRLRAGEGDAFLTLVRRHQSGLHAVALWHVRDAAVADEVVQETWEAVVRGIDRFEGRSSVSTWIRGIVANRAKTRALRERRSAPFSSFGEESEAMDADRFNAQGAWAAPPVPWARGAEDIVADRQLLGHLADAMQTLPEQQRLVVWMRDVEGVDSAEVCNVLGLTETNQRVLLHRGRSRLRAALEAHLGAS